MGTTRYTNTVLQHLDDDILERLQLKPVTLDLGQNLEVPGETLTKVFFVEEGIGSMTAVFKNGAQVEVGMFGYESVVGVSGLMGTKKALNHTFMQLGGRGFSSPMAAAKAEFKLNGKFHDIALRYVQAQLTQATQSAACNATHNHTQRLARWLLICADRAKKDTLALSQEYLAEMLGSQRTTVTLAAGVLKSRGLIEYRRGSIHILDAKALEKEACECYLVVKEHLANFAEFDTGFAV
jgi:CRP-like cAMP-binding protein